MVDHGTTEAPGDGTVELEIHEVIETGPGQASVAVRCLRGPVFLDAGFTQLSGSARAIDLKLTRMVEYGREMPQLDPVHTALVTLRGEGVQHLRSSARDTGFQVVQGANAVP
ncbi:hypothetical protein [Amycolatopsis sp. NPDC051372]